MTDLTGKMTLRLNEEVLKEICRKHIAGFEPERFEIVALRLFSASELIFTIYAHDLLYQTSSLPEGKIPVRKFKIEDITISELLELMRNFNFTVCHEKCRLEEMEVINK